MPTAMASRHWPLPLLYSPAAASKAGDSFRCRVISIRILPPLPSESERCLVSSPFLLAWPLRTADTLSARRQVDGMRLKRLSPFHSAPCGRCLSPRALNELLLYGDPVEPLGTQHWRGEVCVFLLEPSWSLASPRLPSKFRVR